MARARAVSPFALRWPTLTFCKSTAGEKDVNFLHEAGTASGWHVGGQPLTWSSRYWTMISCPEAAASIRGVNPDPGSLPDEGEERNRFDNLSGGLFGCGDVVKEPTWRLRRRCYPAGTSPSAGDPCWCSGTAPSSLDCPSAPARLLAWGGGVGERKKPSAPEQLWSVDFYFYSR